jgi:hypothetical protein
MGVEELGHEAPYSFWVVFLEEVAAVWEGGELGEGVVALDPLHGFGDVGERAVVFAVDEADGRFVAGELAGDFGEAAEAEAAACFDEGFARGGALEWGGVWGEDFAVEAGFVGDAELHGADDALGAHEEVAEAGRFHRDEEELHCPGSLWVDQGVEEDDFANTAGVADCPEEADGAA